MTDTTFGRLLVALAGLMGAAGVILAAAAAHVPDAGRLGPASAMLLFHASAVVMAVLAAANGLAQRHLGHLAATIMVIGAALFAADLSLRQFADRSLFPMAAPTGGTLLIVGWLTVSLAAIAPRRR